MHSLKGVYDVILVVEWVLLEIPKGYLFTEVEASLCTYLESIIKLIDGKDLMVDEWQTVILHILQVVETVKLDVIKVFKSVF